MNQTAAQNGQNSTQQANVQTTAPPQTFTQTQQNYSNQTQPQFGGQYMPPKPADNSNNKKYLKYGCFSCLGCFGIFFILFLIGIWAEDVGLDENDPPTNNFENSNIEDSLQQNDLDFPESNNNGLEAFFDSFSSGSSSSNSSNNFTGNVSGIPILGTGVENINSSSINPLQADPLILPDVLLYNAALKILVNKNWNGNVNSIPLNYTDFDSRTLNTVLQLVAERRQRLQIPVELNDLYEAPQSQQNIVENIYAARQEYLNYLRQKGVAQAYLNELENYTVKEQADRLVYVYEDDPNPPTSLGPFINSQNQSNFREQVLTINSLFLYNNTAPIEDSRILGPMPTEINARREYHRRAINMALRMSVYHEMTHGLQRAVVSYHAPADRKTDKVAHNHASKTLIPVSSNLFWKWPGLTINQTINDRIISQESQADGIMFDVLFDNYNFSNTQQQAYLDHYLYNLDQSKAQLSEINTLFDRNFPEVDKQGLGTYLDDAFDNYPNNTDKTTLRRQMRNSDFLPNHWGYLNPMMNTEAFWRAVSTTN